MIRPFRVADAPRLFELLGQNFPEEEALYGMRPDSWGRVMKRIYRWDVRFLLRLLDLVGKPVYRFYTVEADGRLAATTIVSFAARAGYISMVMVDPSYRRRGYARLLLARSQEETQRVHRPYVALDVLSDNAPAIALYRSLGYRDLREVGRFARPLGAGAPPPAPGSRAGIRPFRSRDRRPLWEIAAGAIPPPVAEVLTLRRGALQSSFSLDRILSSSTESWVLEQAGAPVAWASATVSDVMEAAGLSAPVVGAAADPTGVARLMGCALEWAASRGAVRAVSQVALGNSRSVAALEGAGFSLAHRLLTLYRPAAS